MFKSNLKKAICFASALVLCTGAVSCRDKRKEAAVTETVQLSLKSASIGMADNFSKIKNIDIDRNSGEIMIFGQLETGGWSGYITDSDFSDYKEFHVTPEESETIMSAVLLKYGKKTVLTCINDHARLRIFDSDGIEESVIDCKDIELDSESNAIIFGTDEGYLINMDNRSIASIDISGNYLGNVSTNGASIFGMTKNAEGGITVLLSDMNKMQTAQIDGMSLVNKQECTNRSSSALTMSAGAGEYSCIAVFYDGLYGLKNNDWVLISDLMDTEFNAFDFYGIIMTAENEFAVLSAVSGSHALNLLTERDVSELKTKQVIRIADCMGSDIVLSDIVKYYNSEHESSDYRVEIVDYSIEGEAIDKAFEKLKLDMISGNSPDIIPFGSEMPIDTFSSKEDIFVDMYTLLDNDPDLSREDFLPNILEALESDGRLLSVSPSFVVSIVAANPGYEGVCEGWTIDDMITAYEAAPAGIDFFSQTEEQPRIVFWDLYGNTSMFVDYDNAECSFDSPEFIKYISFFQENEIGLTWEEYEQNNSSGFLDDSDDEAFITTRLSWFNFSHVHSDVKGRFGGEIVLTGFPGPDSGSLYLGLTTEYGIMANSKNVDGAWDFIRTMFSDYYYDNIERYSFPVTVDKFNEMCDEHTKDKTYVDSETGETVTEKWTYQNNASGEHIPIDNFTSEECELYKNYIKSAKVRKDDSQVYNICREEIQYYFEGERSAEETAAIIQNRISIYLSEHYG